MTSENHTTLTDTGERMIPEFHKGVLIYAEHYIRYLACKKFIKGKVVLDIACGSGYGTKLISEHARRVIGVDIDKDTVAYAKDNFGSSNIEYKVGDGEKIPLDDNSVDVVITFETIEHIPNYKKFIKEVKRVLKNDGVAIVSTPNDLEFALGNHFHLHEFQYKELVDILKKDFNYIDSYYQATYKYVALGEEATFKTQGALGIETINTVTLDPDHYLYFYLVCSNEKITEKILPIGAIGSHYSDRQEQSIMNQLDGLTKDKLELEDNLKNSVNLNNQLTNDLKKELNNISTLENEIKHIKSSRTYRLSKRMQTIKDSLVRR